jgi:class 3 adenylate cyclase
MKPNKKSVDAKLRKYLSDSKLKIYLRNPQAKLFYKENPCVSSYSLIEIKETFNKLKTLRKRNKLKNGVYYVVLVDLSKSTESAMHLGPSENAERIVEFVEMIKKSLAKSNSKNTAEFIKDVGDCGLLIFGNIEDILKWNSHLQALINRYNARVKRTRARREVKYRIIQTHTCIHLGEMHFVERNPLCLAINQTFKFEKMVKPGQIGITETVANTIMPHINNKRISISTIGTSNLGSGRKQKIYRVILKNVQGRKT